MFCPFLKMIRIAKKMRLKKVLEKAREEGEALSFDNVGLITGYSEVMPDQVLVDSRFSRKVGLKIPIASAAMDTVTEYRLAIELAKLGGIGVIHRSLSPEEQASQVARVKHHLNGLIERPVCVFEDETISSILLKREEKGYSFHSFPVLSRAGKLVGLVTGNDFEFCDNLYLTAKEIMSTAPIFGKEGMSIDDAYGIMKEQKKKVIPLVDKGGSVVGMYIFSDLKRI